MEQNVLYPQSFPHDILGVDHRAGAADIAEAFARACREKRSPAETLRWAFEELQDPRRRLEYEIFMPSWHDIDEEIFAFAEVHRGKVPLPSVKVGGLYLNAARSAARLLGQENIPEITFEEKRLEAIEQESTPSTAPPLFLIEDLSQYLKPWKE